MNEYLLEGLGVILRTLREELKISSAELAEHLEIKAETLRMIETAELDVDVVTLHQLAAYLETDCAHLLTDALRLTKTSKQSGHRLTSRMRTIQQIDKLRTQNNRIAVQLENLERQHKLLQQAKQLEYRNNLRDITALREQLNDTIASVDRTVLAQKERERFLLRFLKNKQTKTTSIMRVV